MMQEIENQLVAPSPRTARPEKMTYEEFLESVEEGTWAEWVNGEVIFMSPASHRHQNLVGFLAALLRCFAETLNLGEVLTPPFQMKTGPRLGGREPDIIFIAREHLDRLKPTYLDGPADLVVEIISTDSRSRDRGDKFYEYEEGGVGEYWLLDPIRRQAEFYVRGGDGIFHLAPIGEDGVYSSTILKGLALEVEWLWQDPLPRLMDVLKRWKLI